MRFLLGNDFGAKRMRSFQVSIYITQCVEASSGHKDHPKSFEGKPEVRRSVKVKLYVLVTWEWSTPYLTTKLRRSDGSFGKLQGRPDVNAKKDFLLKSHWDTEVLIGKR